jgi:hypothetical protein
MGRKSEEVGETMMNKSMSVDDTLAQRGSVYGEFRVQLETVGSIVEIMKFAYITNNIEYPSKELMAEWHYLAIKLARVAVNPDHIDSYHDLAGYATLMERERIR